ncbi:MAG: hypothetical protein LBB51_05745 [Zoogloeaceae bacterium]|jgi:uncharacterized protein|nr:hypothetical protein [Zoogloeaceae bacterium]
MKIRFVLLLASLLAALPAAMSTPASARSLREVCRTTPLGDKFAFFLEKFADDAPVTQGGAAKVCRVGDYSADIEDCADGHVPAYWRAVDLNGDRHYDLVVFWSSGTPNQYNDLYALYVNCGDELFVSLSRYYPGGESKSETLASELFDFSDLFLVRPADKNHWAGLRANRQWEVVEEGEDGEMKNVGTDITLEFDAKSFQYRIVKESEVKDAEDRHPDAISPIPMAFVPEITLGKFPDAIKSYVAPPEQTAVPRHAPPSFSCAKAATSAENTICADPDLSRRDTLLALNYKLIRSAALAAESRRLTLEQRAWIEERNACETVKCLNNAYGRRITAVCNDYPLDPDARPLGAKRKRPDHFVTRIAMKYDEPNVFVGVPYKVEFDDERHAVKTGKVGKNGIIDVKRPRNAKTAKIVVYAYGKENRGYEWRIHLDDRMENYMTLKGMQSRLKNLGFYTGEINGVLDPKTQTAMRDFMGAQKVSGGSNVDNCLRVRLLNQHDF